MSSIEIKKQQLQKLVDRVNSSPQRNKIELSQQRKTEKHIDIIGGNGRLNTSPTSKGFDIGLQGISLTKEMYDFMCKLTGRTSDKYGYPRDRKSPKWEIDDFKKVEEAVYRYANTVK